MDEVECPYVVVDARYEKVREAGAIRSRAVQTAVGIDTEGQRHMLAAELAEKESEASWTAFPTGLNERGLHGVQYVVSDSLEGLNRAIEKVFATALWQRCAVHFRRNANDRVTRHTDPACTDTLSCMRDHENLDQARTAL